MSAVAPSLAGRVEAIVIGASAGGVEALSTLLAGAARGPARRRSSSSLHLPRERPEPARRDLRSRSARCRSREAEDKEPVAAGTVYFAPPDYHLLVDDGPQLALSADAAGALSRGPSIDVLFESAADAYGARLLGVVLTGANEDGAAGLRRQCGAPAASRSCRSPTARSRRRCRRRRSARRRPTYVLALPAIAATAAARWRRREAAMR